MSFWELWLCVCENKFWDVLILSVTWPSGDIPSLEGAATQINNLKSLQGLSKVFLATDAPLQERKKLAKLVKGVVWYTPSQTELNRFGDGGVAIIDQWISSHAKFFVGK